MDKRNTQLKKIETRNDGKDLQRFQAMLKTVVSVPKDEIRKKDEKSKKGSKAKA